MIIKIPVHFCLFGLLLLLQLVISTPCLASPCLSFSIQLLLWVSFSFSLYISILVFFSLLHLNTLLSLSPKVFFFLSLSCALWKVGNSVVCIILTLGLDLGALLCLDFPFPISLIGLGYSESIFDSLDFCSFFWFQCWGLNFEKWQKV